MSLALEMADATIRIVTFDGHTSEATVFLHTLAGDRSQPETLGARLNDAELVFLPTRVGGAVELVHLAWVAYVAVAGRPRDVHLRDEIGALRAKVELDLATRERLAGELVYAPPQGGARVSDWLNRGDERFLVLLREHDTLFVNHAAVVRAREL